MRYALKIIRSSDIGWFRCHFDPSVSKQKAFNIDKAPFRQMFPHFERAGNQFVVPVTIHGPENKDPLQIDRKILLQEKNWRLNGAFIYDPPADQTRFHSLKVEDFAILGFDGEEYPTAVEMILVGRYYSQDYPLWFTLNKTYGPHFKGRGGFINIEAQELDSIAAMLQLDLASGLGRVLSGGEIEALGQGDSGAINRLASRGLSLTPDQVARAKTEAEKTGRRGEELIDYMLNTHKLNGNNLGYSWDSRINPYGPFDFTVDFPNGQRRVDVKSTKRGFSERIYVSVGELREMAYGSLQYDIIRVFEMTTDRCKCAIAHDVREWALSRLQEISALSFRVDTIIVEPSSLQFGETLEIIKPAVHDPDDDDQD